MTTRRLLLASFAAILLGIGAACAADNIFEASNGDTVELPSSLPADEQERIIAEVESESERLAAAADSAAAVVDSLESVYDEAAADSINAAAVLAYCEPQSYASDMELIGPKGGLLRVGQHMVQIPKDALSENVLITAEALAGNELVVRLSPAGLVFAKDIKLRLSYRGCEHLRKDAALRLAYIDDQGTVIEYPASNNDKQSGEVDGAIRHFSKYAVAY